jgi:serine/threonine protein kinase
MLTVNPNLRPTASEILIHDWLQNFQKFEKKNEKRVVKFSKINKDTGEDGDFDFKIKKKLDEGTIASPLDMSSKTYVSESGDTVEGMCMYMCLCIGLYRYSSLLNLT